MWGKFTLVTDAVSLKPRKIPCAYGEKNKVQNGNSHIPIFNTQYMLCFTIEKLKMQKYSNHFLSSYQVWIYNNKSLENKTEFATNILGNG